MKRVILNLARLRWNRLTKRKSDSEYRAGPLKGGNLPL